MSDIALPTKKDLLVNYQGFPRTFQLPTLKDQGKFLNAMYLPEHVTTDWDAYHQFLKSERPDFKSHVLLMGHDMSEIENITLMSLGGVVRDMGGKADYILTGSQNIATTNEMLEKTGAHWLGISLYTGLTDFVFDWLRQYKIDAAARITGKKLSFEEADTLLKNMVREARGPIWSGNKLLYAPVIIGGHYNNYNFKESWDRGAEFVVRGKGINLFRDILLGLFQPGIYHDPMPYANLPRLDRKGFYEATVDTKGYATSPIKSILTALGCAYSCSYCYVSSLTNNLKDAYKGTNIVPPSIIQDRPLETVLKEGHDIIALDKFYNTKTAAVFDQADISLNNMTWWEDLRVKWGEQIKIPFYIQARPAMLAGTSGQKRIEIISKSGLVAGISMAIESGDPQVRKNLLRRNENNDVILDAVKNVKAVDIPLRTQMIVGLPVLEPAEDKKAGLELKLESFYKDPIQESLTCLELVCRSNFAKEDYYWNSLYSPFPGTPLGDYSVKAGFATDTTDNRSYQFVTESGLSCFDDITAARQIAFSQTSNFFAHFRNGKDLMVLFLYGENKYDLEAYAKFIADRARVFDTKEHTSKFEIIPNIGRKELEAFFQYAYEGHEEFKQINLLLTDYYLNLLDGLILAAKVAERYFKKVEEGKPFVLSDLYRAERLHYYDNSYNMAYIPKTYKEYLSRHLPMRRPSRMAPEVVPT
ncbi:MAG: radical SAM protein [Bdellovibrionales bacterium]